MRCCCPCGAPSDEDDAYRRHVDPAGSSADPAAAVSSVAVGEDDFELLRVLGRGTYGKVVQVLSPRRSPLTFHPHPHRSPSPLTTHHSPLTTHHSPLTTHHVVQARKSDSGRLYAMKIMRKQDVITRNQVKHTLTERHVLQSVRHPFIIGLQFAFQTTDKLYLVLPFMAGGELFFHLRRERTFSEPEP